MDNIWEKIEQIDWESYKIPGIYAPDILPLIRGLVSEDWMTRDNAYGNLLRVIDWIYDEGINDLPFILIPILIGFVEAENVIDKLVLTSLLVTISTYSETKSPNEPFRSRAKRTREAVCKGSNAYRKLLVQLSDVETEEALAMRDDLSYLIKTCEST